ncbi:unnamed protein product, partial [Effrenium voratum]
EILAEKPASAQLSFDSNGMIKVSKHNQLTECSVSGELKLRAAFTRRALAYELATRGKGFQKGGQGKDKGKWDASHLFGFEYLAEADLAKAVVYLSPLRAKQNTLPCYAPAWRIVCKRRLMRPLVPEFKDFLHVPTEVTQPGWPCDDDGAQPAPIKRLRQMYKYGVQWSPQEFFAQAKQVLHPRDPQSALLDCTKQAIFDNLTMSAVELAKLRLRAVLMIKGVVSDLEDQERQLKASMEPGVSAILSSKKILAWQALLEASHYEDMQVVELVKQGITLDGVHSCPPCYPPDWKPATLDSQDLLDTAVWRRRVLVAECDDGDTARQQDVHETTLAEVELGHLQGPFTEQQISEHFGTDHWLLNPRFAIYQGEEKKVRIIDDCRRSSLNSTYSVNFRLELMDVDTLACLIGTIGESIAAGTALLSMADGTVLRGDVVEAAAKGSWMGRTVDLSKAYKQLAIHPTSRKLCVLGYPFGGEWKFYLCGVLPFGVGHKAVDFAAEFSALGVVVQLGRLDRGSFVLANKRTRELRQLCDLAMCMLRSLKPRVYSVVSVKLPILIFTDGAWESGVASAGVAMYFPQEGGGVVAPIAVPDELVKLWLDEVGDQLICQIEMFAFLAIRWIFSDALSNRFTIAWIDNDAARFACVKGTSRSVSLQAMARVLQHLEAQDPSLVWYERVASFSNPGDMPSRGKVRASATLLGLRESDPFRVPDALIKAVFQLHANPLSFPCVPLTGANSGHT